MYKNYKGTSEKKLTFFEPYKGKFRISSKYGKRKRKEIVWDQNKQKWKTITIKEFHRGTDHVGIDTKTIRSIGKCRVIRKGFQKNGAGLFVVCQSLWYSDYVEIKYFHLSKTDVNIGDVLHAKEAIGIEGDTGHSFGSHLHLEVWVNGKLINPRGKKINWIK